MKDPQQPNDSDLRERLRNLKRTSPTDPRYPIHAYEDDLVALIQDEILKARIDERESMKFIDEKGEETFKPYVQYRFVKDGLMLDWEAREAQLNQPNTNKETE